MILCQNKCTRRVYSISSMSLEQQSEHDNEHLFIGLLNQIKLQMPLPQHTVKNENYIFMIIQKCVLIVTTQRAQITYKVNVQITNYLNTSISISTCYTKSDTFLYSHIFA